MTACVKEPYSLPEKTLLANRLIVGIRLCTNAYKQTDHPSRRTICVVRLFRRPCSRSSSRRMIRPFARVYTQTNYQTNYLFTQFVWIVRLVFILRRMISQTDYLSGYISGHYQHIGSACQPIATPLPHPPKEFKIHSSRITLKVKIPTLLICQTQQYSCTMISPLAQFFSLLNCN